MAAAAAATPNGPDTGVRMVLIVSLETVEGEETESMASRGDIHDNSGEEIQTVSRNVWSMMGCSCKQEMKRLSI